MPIEDIKEAWPSSQIEDIEDELGAVFEARGEAAEDEADEVDETELPELSAEEVIRMGLPAVPTSWEPMAAVPELDLEVINLPDELIFAPWRAGEPIGGINADVKSDDLPDQNEDSECSAYCTLADQIGMASGRCRSEWDLPIRVQSKLVSTIRFIQPSVSLYQWYCYTKSHVFG